MFKRRTRLPDFPYTGEYRYFLTFCTHDRQRAFVDSGVVDLTLSQFVRSAADHGFEIPAYCFMPDHVHLLVSGTREDSDLKKFASSAKQFSGYAYRQKTGKRLWQPSYYEHVLRDEDDTWGVAWYIVANPVRAGLTDRLDDYPFIGSCTTTRTELLHSVQIAPPWKFST